MFESCASLLSRERERERERERDRERASFQLNLNQIIKIMKTHENSPNARNVPGPALISSVSLNFKFSCLAGKGEMASPNVAVGRLP